MKYPRGAGLFDPPNARAAVAQPLVSLDPNGQPFYSPLFVALPAQDQAIVRAQGDALAREWAERQSAQAVPRTSPIAPPTTPMQELTDAIGETAAALLGAISALNRMSGAVRSCELERKADHDT